MNAMKCSIFVFVLYGIMLDSAFGEDRNIKLSDFKAKIATSEEWINLYRIEVGQPTERIRLKIKVKWSMIGADNNTVLRNTVTWRPETDKCVLVDVMSKPDETEAWGQGGVVLKQVNSTFKRQIRFVSANASSYFWWVVCFNSEDMVDSHCPDLLVMLMVPASRLIYNREPDMTGLPLEDIVADLHAIDDTISFTNQRLRYTWLGTECDLNNNKVKVYDCPQNTGGSMCHRSASELLYVVAILSISVAYLTNK